MNAPERSTLAKDENQISAKEMLVRLKEAAGIAQESPESDEEESEYGLSKNKTATLYRWDSVWWAMTPPGADYKKGMRPDVPYIGPMEALSLVNSGDLVFGEDRVNLRLKTLKDAYKREDASPTKAAKRAAAKPAKAAKPPKVKKEKAASTVQEDGLETKVRRTIRA